MPNLKLTNYLRHRCKIFLKIIGIIYTLYLVPCISISNYVAGSKQTGHTCSNS